MYRTGGTNCGFATFAQCQAAVSGLGGVCNQVGGDEPARRPAVERLPRAAHPKPPPRPVQPAPQPSAPTPTAVPTAPIPALTPDAEFAYARQLVVNGHFQAGITALRALNRDDQPDIAAYIGFANRRLERIDEAKAWYERALAADPDHKLTLSFYGMLRAEQGDLQAAQADLVRIGRLCGNTQCNEYQSLQGVIAARMR
jgi:tetratricopeptide (TPR) repeat protein